MKRILIYSHDTFGLGNIRRMLEIARHLVETSTEVSVLVITGSPMLHAFRIPPRIDYLKLPCLARDVSGNYGSRSLPLALDETVVMRANLIRSALVDFRPDLLLVDKKPFGVQDELLSALAALPIDASRPKLALLLRDILDSPESTIRIWKRNGYYDAIERWYDRVLVVGSPAVYDLRREYAMPSRAAAKVRFCGYIAREPGLVPRAEQRAALGLAGDEPLVLVTPGGGEDGFELIETYLRGLKRQVGVPHPRTHVVCGPEMGAARRDALQQLARTLPAVSFQVFSDDMMGLIRASDLVVSMAGYNTVCEFLSCARRAIVVPRVKPGEEQLIRARRMASQGLLRCLEPADATPERLMQLVQGEIDALRSQVPVRPLRDMAGLHGVASAIFEMMSGAGVGTPVVSRRIVRAPIARSPVAGYGLPALP